MVPSKEKFKFYLASWQSRMVQDFLGIKEKVKVVTINPGVIQCPASYKIPAEGLSRHDWVLYLNDEQMLLVQEQFQIKTPISGINITEGLMKSKDVVFR